jgi:hypothetical protein
MKPRLSIAIVNWNSGPRLEAGLASLYRENDPAGFEVLVADNASTDGSADAAAGHPGIRLLRQPTNRGFAAGANAAAREAGADRLLFLNPDITHTPDNVGTLLDAVDGRPEAAGGCGCLVDGQGRVQRDFQLRRLPSPAWALAELFLPHRLRTRGPWFRRHYYAQHRLDRPFPVEQPAAACLLLRTDVFHKLGGFDEAFQPAWFEDVDLCRRLFDRGYRLWFIPAATFIHEGGYSASVMQLEDFLTAYWGNACRYHDKHHPAFAPTYRRLAQLGLAIRALCAADPRRRRACREAGRRLGALPAPAGAKRK